MGTHFLNCFPHPHSGLTVWSGAACNVWVSVVTLLDCEVLLRLSLAYHYESNSTRYPIEHPLIWLCYF